MLRKLKFGTSVDLCYENCQFDTPDDVRRNPGMVRSVFYAIKASVWHLQLSMLRKLHYTMTDDICYENLSIVPLDDLYHESLVRDPEYLCYENSSKILYMIYAMKIPIILPPMIYATKTSVWYFRCCLLRKSGYAISDDLCEENPSMVLPISYVVKTPVWYPRWSMLLKGPSIIYAKKPPVWDPDDELYEKPSMVPQNDLCYEDLDMVHRMIYATNTLVWYSSWIYATRSQYDIPGDLCIEKPSMMYRGAEKSIS